ncbi:sensor histidine kinase [Paenibacillus roseipurpureus]|uniref:Sensor histidine kinase n=1 Tax=Paenibacillus roseopurpureus TaxID=2918901 RepID=A0AA96LQI2_9BACL|nr:sensor histidine kinase [Paenibacillus sp. MBLB1832]WNR46155.1 sensor histidine kinase [Paenibacillus sp. MBLB1832]
MWARPLKQLFLNNISIKNRLLIYFLSLVLIPSTIIVTSLYHQSSSTISENMTDSIDRSMRMMELNILETLEQIDDITTKIYTSNTLQGILSSDRPGDDIGIINEMTQLTTLLDSYSLSNQGRTKFTLNLFLMNRPEYHLFPFIPHVYSVESVQNLEWYQSMPYKTRFKVLGLYQEDSKSGILPMYYIRTAKQLYELDNFAVPYAGMITADVNITDFGKNLDNLKPSPHSEVYILNAAGEVMIGNRIDEVNQPFIVSDLFKDNPTEEKQDFQAQFRSFHGEQTLIASKFIPLLNWKIVTVSPLRDLNGKLLSFRNVMIIVILISMVMALILALFLSNNITNPIRKFVRAINTTDSELFNVSINYKRNDEFLYLFQRFNKMIRQMKELVDQLYVSEVKKKKAELEALQAQINPHFLYNTLDSINWMALKKKVPEISLMVTSLSDFFRLSLNKGRSIILLEDELNQAQAYLTIQQIRLSNKLTFAIEAPSHYLQFVTVKLILQPLIENAIIHGFNASKGRGHLVINVSLEQEIVTLRISDNGSGSEAEVLKMQELLNGTGGDTASFGIRNVHTRIQQWFGEQYGLQYEANLDQGLTAIIRIPARKTADGLSNDHLLDHSENKQ